MKTETNTQNEHTATPWTYRSVTGLICTEKGNLHFIAEVHKHKDDGRDLSAEDYANAAFIVRAVNAHDALVEALADAHDFIDAIVDATEGAGRIDQNSSMRLGERLKTTARNVHKRTSAALALAKEGKAE